MHIPDPARHQPVNQPAAAKVANGGRNAGDQPQHHADMLHVQPLRAGKIGRRPERGGAKRGMRANAKAKAKEIPAVLAKPGQELGLA